jgi:hypothetical protein
MHNNLIERTSLNTSVQNYFQIDHCVKLFFSDWSWNPPNWYCRVRRVHFLHRTGMPIIWHTTLHTKNYFYRVD